MKNANNIVYIESNAILRKGLSLYLLEQSFVATVKEFERFDLVSDGLIKETDVLIFDTQDDFEFRMVRRWRALCPKLKMVILSSKERLLENYLFAQVTTIAAFFTKAVNPDKFVETLQTIINIEASRLTIVEDMPKKGFGEISKDRPFSEKERQLLRLLGKGKTSREIAGILNLSFRTIETHRRRMIEKIGCKNIIPVILYAIGNGDIYFDADRFLDTGFIAS